MLSLLRYHNQSKSPLNSYNSTFVHILNYTKSPFNDKTFSSASVKLYANHTFFCNCLYSCYITASTVTYHVMENKLVLLCTTTQKKTMTTPLKNTEHCHHFPNEMISSHESFSAKTCYCLELLKLKYQQHCHNRFPTNDFGNFSFWFWIHFHFHQSWANWKICRVILPFVHTFVGNEVLKSWSFC